MSNPFPNGYSASAVGAFSVSPSDDTDLPHQVRAVTLGVGGVVSYDGWDGETYTTSTLPAGTYPMLAKRIRADATTATSITGWI